MKIFISWSGDLSKELGEVFRKWIPAVIQSVKPYFTPDDIEKGSRWYPEIAIELEASEVGIMILTKDNLSSPWMLFEAGALSKKMDKSRICPVLFGIENTDLVGPLAQFQTTAFVEEDMQKLMRTINNASGESKLEEGIFNSVFNKWWPELEGQIIPIMEKPRVDNQKDIRTDREIIEEILALSRMTASKIREDERFDVIQTDKKLHSVDCQR